MRFLLRRYISGLRKRSHLLLLVCIAPMAYLLFSALSPHQYEVVQQISVDPAAPVAVATSPVDFETVLETIRRPDGFLGNPFALRELDTVVKLDETAQDLRLRSLQILVTDHMQLRMPADGLVEVAFSGSDRELGEKLVRFYSERFVARVLQGLTRAVPLEEGTGEKPAQLLGEMKMTPLRALWSSGRILPLLLIALISLLGVLCLLGILEWNDPSFKSERQVAQYLGLPLMGSLPDLKKMLGKLDRNQ